MSNFVGDFLGSFLAGILPGFVTNMWDRYVLRRLLKRPPKQIITEANLFLEILFPENTPSLSVKDCYYLPDSQHFFTEKVDILDSLEKYTDGEVDIICRVPWLVMPNNYRDIYLSSPEARAYYAMLERQARLGKLKYLYNFGALNHQSPKEAILKGKDLNCLPMLLQSTNFDIMIVHTDRHRYKVIFANRAIGFRDQEHGIGIQQKNIYLLLKDYFDHSWNEASTYWAKQIQTDLKSVNELLLPLQPHG